MSFFSGKKESDVVLVFDIGSGSVAGALVLISAEHPATILYSFRSEIPFQHEATGIRLLSLMLRSLSQVMLAITREGFELAGMGARRPRIREAFVSLSAPWVVSQTSFLSLRNKAPTKITTHVFAELLKHSEEDGHPERKPIPKGGVLIERKLIKSVLNGYATATPYEKEAITAEFAVFESFSVPKVTEKIADTITELIHPGHISFHSFSLLAFATLRELYPNKEHFMLIDVSGEQTELSLIRGGVLSETVTFPFGRNHFVRALRRHAEVPVSGASAVLKLYRDNNGVGRLFERSKKTLDTIKGEWQEKLSKSLSNFSEETLLPRSIFLTADEDLAPILSGALQSGEVGGLTLSPSQLEVTVVGNETLAPLVAYSSSDTRDPFLGLICALASRLEHGKNLA
ncbi:MAG: hypothetical protein Q7R64_01230 [bacterium]|nr:hypothetical protein [bacterium]